MPNDTPKLKSCPCCGEGEVMDGRRWKRRFIGAGLTFSVLAIYTLWCLILYTRAKGSP